MIVTLAEVKTYLGITDNTQDTFLTEQILVIQSAIEGYCNRKFEAVNVEQTFYYDDLYDPTLGTVARLFHLAHYPIITFTSIEADGELLVEGDDYRLHKATATLILKRSIRYFEDLLVTYRGGYEAADIPPLVKTVAMTLIQERYNKKASGIPLNFGSDVQRVSIPGVIGIDFDYSLTSNDRVSAFGSIIGSQANILDYYRSENVVVHPDRLRYVEVV